ncbi:protein translocase subunit SecD [Nocardioides sp.]|uniref:protein translocase subunit SecD n=1 Tax=Nocardioides sp. TaxID=35761 RepID=UPI003D145D38
MAKKSAHPGRTIVVFFLATAVVFGLVALGGKWKPELGLDLQGGTRVTLTAKDTPGLNSASLQEAADIIDQRVNGSGYSEAEVTTQGSNIIIVELPGPPDSSLVDVVSRQAQLRFRLVALAADGTAPAATGSPSASPSETPGSGVIAPSATPTAKATKKATTRPSATATPKNRPLPGYAAPTATPTKKATTKATASASASPTATASPTDGATASNTDGDSTQSATGKGSIADALAWQASPDAKSQAAFAAFSCPADGKPAEVDDNPDKPLITCDNTGQKFLLSVAIIEGTQVKSASSGIPQNSVSYAVDLTLDSKGADQLAEVSRALVGGQATNQTFAITLDGQVISHPGFTGVITDGRPQITGDFTQQEAADLATSLKFGSLPIAFNGDPSSEEIGPSLAGDQLTAGITAGAIGLLLVMLYCLLYYRGLGLVVIASLVVAGALTYGLVLLLSATAGFTLTLPGIAGLIVAVGITADSFIVFFERIRDEMRDGKSMRVAVESGWVRARNTCLAADAVSLLAAVVLYFFAAGVVKGFAFALGLSTLIDLVVFFWFTKPMVSWLGQFAFFNKGHKLSGLDAESLGLDRLPGVAAGGKA